MSQADDDAAERAELVKPKAANPGQFGMPGRPKPEGSGRQTGTPNKATELMRAGIKSAIDTCRQGGLTPVEIMMESSRVLHAVARYKGEKKRVGAQTSLAQALGELGNDELAVIVELFCKASDIAARAAPFGFPKLAQVDYVGDLPASNTGAAQVVDNRVVVVLKIGDEQPRPQGVVVEHQRGNGHGDI